MNQGLDESVTGVKQSTSASLASGGIFSISYGIHHNYSDVFWIALPFCTLLTQVIETILPIFGPK